MNLVFLILAHDDPESVRETIDLIISQNQQVIVHYDSSSPPNDISILKERFAAKDDQVRIISELHCTWGHWSLVEASLICLREVQRLNWPCDYVHLMSGVERLIKPIKTLEEFLLNNKKKDFIEAVNIKTQKWVKGGLEIERFQYHFPYSYQTERDNFESYLEEQKKGIKRILPLSITPHMGSQWWTLRWNTIDKILNFLTNKPEVTEYFSTTWIPDESFFQTLVAHLIPKSEITNTQLVYHKLAQNGRPVIFMNGHEEFLSQLPHFFARKISANAHRVIELGKINKQKNEISIDSLRDAKKSADQTLSLLYKFNSDTVWTHCNIVTEKIIFLIHDESLNTNEIDLALTSCDNIDYLHRPFHKNRISIPQKLLSKVGLKKDDLEFKYRRPVDFLKAIVNISPGKQYYVISYVPQKDWIEEEVINILQNYCAYRLINKTGSTIENNILESKLIHEQALLFKDCKRQITLSELTEELLLSKANK